MPELIAKSALQRQAPLTRGDVTLAELPTGTITSIAVFPGGAKGVAKALKTLGLAFPEPNTWSAKGEARIVWTGRDQAFLIGADLATGLDAHAAVTDQSDGWARLSLKGASAVDSLARLVPMDLRQQAFPVGHAARAALNHMNIILLRTKVTEFELFVFRSMARSAWHELAEVMDRLEARAAAKT